MEPITPPPDYYGEALDAAVQQGLGHPEQVAAICAHLGETCESALLPYLGMAISDIDIQAMSQRLSDDLTAAFRETVSVTIIPM